MCRTLTFVFLLDTAFVIFYNTPARMYAAELEMYINSPEPVFKAESAALWFSNLKQWMKETPSYPVTVAGLVEGICEQNLEPAQLRVYSHLSMLNLFVVISGMPSTSLEELSTDNKSTGVHNLPTQELPPTVSIGLPEYRVRDGELEERMGPDAADSRRHRSESPATL